MRYAEDNDHKLMVFAQNQRREWNATNMVVAFSYIRTNVYSYFTFHDLIVLYIQLKNRVLLYIYVYIWKQSDFAYLNIMLRKCLLHF